jgi:thioredoxin 1
MAIIDITDSDFQAKVLSFSLPILVDFWAPWCGPCKLAAPVLEELAKKYEGRLQVIKLNVDENKESPAKYSVMSIPTTILFKENKEIGRCVGFEGKESYEELIKKGVI